MPIIVLGEDPRQKYLCKQLNARGYRAFHNPNGVEDAMCVVFPLFPTVRTLEQALSQCHPQALLCAGLPSKDFLRLANTHGLSVYDYMADREVAQLNAVATAEGAIAEGLRLSKKNLQGSNTLIIGFGLCGEILAQKCMALGANVTVSETDSFRLTHAKAHGFQTLLHVVNLEPYDYLFNTVPAPLITAELIDTLDSDSIIIDLASSPGGTDFDHCLLRGIAAKLCPSLPAIYAPKTSGIILADAVHRRLKQLKS